VGVLGNNFSAFDPLRTSGKPRDAQRFNGDNSTTTFTLNYRVDNPTDLEVFVENVQQEPLTAFDAIGSQLIFTEAPPTGTNNIYVVYRNAEPGVYAQIPDGAVTFNKLANNIRLFTTDNFTGDNTTTAFTLSSDVPDANTLMVAVDGVFQRAPIHYTASGNTITFTSAPPSSSNVHVRHLGFRTTQSITALPANTTITQPTLESPVITGTTSFSDNMKFVGVNPTFQTSAANTTSRVLVAPSGTGQVGAYQAYSSSNTSNSSLFTFRSHSGTGQSQILSEITGSGTYLPIAFYTSGAERLVIPTDAAGIKFPATQAASSDANTLDDYEEGTFTPTFSAGVSSPTYSNTGGHYTKVGNLVTFTIRMTLSGGSAVATRLEMSGLPFTSSSSAYEGGVILNYQGGFYNNEFNMHIPKNSTRIEFYNTDGTSFNGTEATALGATLHLNGFYFSA
jgi:hypothetical protein